MVQRRSVSKVVFDIFNYVFLLVLALVCVMPMWHVLCASLSDPVLLMRTEGAVLWPLGQTSLEGYRIVFKDSGVATGYMNTIIYVLCFTSIGITATLFAGFVLSRPYFKLKGFVTFIITFTMMFSGGMVPTFMMIRDLNLYNTRWAIILPGCMSVFNIIIMRTSIMGIPASLEESAKLDGAGNMTILFQIFVPLIKATVAVLILFMSVGMWNSWFQAMLYLKSRSLYPLQLILREILMRNDTTTMMQQSGMNQQSQIDLYKQLVKYCTTIVATVPILCVYPFVQKYFVTGVMIGSLKG